MLGFFFCLFVLLFNFPKLESLWLQRKEACPQDGVGAGRGQQIPMDLAFLGGCFCRGRVSSQGHMVVSRSPPQTLGRGHRTMLHPLPTKQVYLALGAQSTKIHPTQPPSSLHTPIWDGIACPVPTWGEDYGHLDCTTLAPQITSTPRMGHQVTPPAAHSLKDPWQDEAVYRLH